MLIQQKKIIKNILVGVLVKEKKETKKKWQKNINKEKKYQ